MTRNLTLAALALGVLALAACTHEKPRVALNPHYRLNYDDKGETVALVYGVPKSDDVALMLECSKGSGRIELTDVVRDKQAKAVVLSAGGRSTTVPVTIEADEGGETVSGRLALSAPALQAFRRTGALEVANGRARYVVAADARARAGVDRFFETCG